MELGDLMTIKCYLRPVQLLLLHTLIRVDDYLCAWCETPTSFKLSTRRSTLGTICDVRSISLIMRTNCRLQSADTHGVGLGRVELE
jgi:hypothetical protein